FFIRQGTEQRGESADDMRLRKPRLENRRQPCQGLRCRAIEEVTVAVGAAPLEDRYHQIRTVDPVDMAIAEPLEPDEAAGAGDENTSIRVGIAAHVPIPPSARRLRRRFLANVGEAEKFSGQRRPQGDPDFADVPLEQAAEKLLALVEVETLPAGFAPTR